ncbi:MAG: hypothetical protein AAF944_15070 [Bacteroidota bacterium]
MIRLLFICSLLLFAETYGVAQQRDSLRFRRNSISVVPQYLARQALRIDWEKPLKKGAQIHRLTISPYWYAGTTDCYDFGVVPTSGTLPNGYGDTRVDGFGLEVLDKYTLRFSEQQPSNFYLAFGVGYHRITLDYINYEPAPFEENETTLFRYDFVDQKEAINRLEVIGLIGLKIFSRRNILFLDLFAGPVIKRSWISTDSAAPLTHEKVGDHGFDGVTYRAGVGVGVVIF